MKKEELDIFYKLWFPRNTNSITIVASPSSEDLPCADPEHPNYTQIDTFDDRDAIYHIGMLLSKRYPNAEIHLSCSDEFDRHRITDNLIVIGGPGGDYNNADIDDANEICRFFSQEVCSKITYEDIGNDEFKMIVNNDKKQSEYKDKMLSLDYGYFSAFRNPKKTRNRVIMLHGIHTAGVLGAKKIFDGEEDQSKENLKILDDFFKTKPYNFETFFKVGVFRGIASCPTFNTNSILLLDKKETEKINKNGQAKTNGDGSPAKTLTGIKVI